MLANLAMVLGLVFQGTVADFIATPSNPTYAEVGSSASLNWTYSYHEQPSFKKWYKSTESNDPIGLSIMFKSANQPLTYSNAAYAGRVEYFDNAGLVIRNVSLQDEGYIRFEVNFEDGHSFANKIIFNVTVRPQLTTSLANETVTTEGSNSTLQCTFQARPQPDIKWFMKGQQITSGIGRFLVVNHVLGIIGNTTSIQSILTISNAKIEDNGMVKCSADIPFGTLSSQTNLRVYYTPRNTSLGSNTQKNTGQLGGNVTLSCHTSALPVPFYQIYKNGMLLSNTTSASVTLADLLIHNEGNYTCIPRNLLGNGETDSLFLTVHVPPLLKAFSGDVITAVINATVNISCTFYGEPTPVITWSHGSAAIPKNAKVNTMVLKQNSSFSIVQSILVFETIKIPNHGLYICSAGNSAGNNSQSITLNVEYPPIVKANFSDNYTLTENSNNNASWHCTAQGNPMAKISWTLNGNNIGYGFDGFEIINTANGSDAAVLTSRLVMVGITREKSGSIVCNATSSTGITVSSTNIIINYVPVVSVAIKAINLTLNTQATLSCVVNSQPIAYMYWQTNGMRINASDYIITKNRAPGFFTSRITSNLTIATAKKSDHGYFECIAVNIIGNSSTSTYINILYPPEITRQLHQVRHIHEGSVNNTFVCSVRSNPLSTVTWLFDNTVISSNTRMNIIAFENVTKQEAVITSVLTIKTVTKSDSGNYTCKAENNIGKSASMQQFIVTYKPFAVNVLPGIVTVNASQAVNLSCDFQSNPGADAYWKGLGAFYDARIRNSTSSLTLHSSLQYSTTRVILNILKAIPSDSGVYTCGANNSLGTSEENITVVVKYKPIFISTSQPWIALAIPENTTLNCTVQSHPAASISWYYNNKKLQSNRDTTTIKILTQSQMLFHSTITSTLFVSGTSSNKTGNYTCKASNEIGTMQENSQIIVQFLPRIETSFGLVENKTESTQAYHLECLIEANPAPVIQWLKDSKPIQNGRITNTVLRSSNARTYVKSRLEFQGGIERAHQGTYQCNASNIIDGPVFISNSTGQTNTLKSQNVTFECIAEGHSAPVLQWYKANETLAATRASVITSTKTRTVVQSTLTINNAMKSDTGEYRCKATNIAGNRNQIFKLNVQYKPLLQVTSSNVTANKSDTIELSCKTDANPPVNRYNWTKDGLPMAFTGSIMTIQTVQESSSGVYSCMPINALGAGESVTYDLYVQAHSGQIKSGVRSKFNTPGQSGLYPRGSPWIMQFSQVETVYGESFYPSDYFDELSASS
eukprot:gene10647-11775_t